MLDTADHASLLCLPHPFRLCDGSACLQTERTALRQPTKSSAGDQQSERGHLHSHQRRACLGWELPSEAKERMWCALCLDRCVVVCAWVVCAWVLCALCTCGVRVLCTCVLCMHLYTFIPPHSPLLTAGVPMPHSQCASRHRQYHCLWLYGCQHRVASCHLSARQACPGEEGHRCLGAGSNGCHKLGPYFSL